MNIPDKLIGYKKEELIIYTDGSNNNTKGIGYGFLILDKDGYIIAESCGHLSDKKYTSHRNVYGEIIAAMRAINFCIEKTDCKKFHIFADYEGVIHWANKTWKRNKPLTMIYNKFIEQVRNEGYEIKIEHVDGHTGVHGNELADILAKKGRDEYYGDGSSLWLHIDGVKTMIR